MSDPLKASRLMLLGALHGAVVTDVAFDDGDGLIIDPQLAEAAGFLEHEKVELHDATSGHRLACALRFGAEGKGGLVIAGAAAQLVKPGERVTLASYGWMKGKPAAKHRPRVVQLSADNQLPKRAKAP